MKKRIVSSFMTFLMICSLVMYLPAGNITASADSTIETALNWAVNIANDDSHGYSWDGRWGPDYDCSSLVISAFRKAGLSLTGATTTVNMKSVFTKEGFTWIPASQINLSNSNSLIRGDILLNESSHTEIYLGGGMNVGAHRGHMSQWCSHSEADKKYHRHGHYSLGEQKGDQDGGEISVAGYYSYPWDGVLRYTAPTPFVKPTVKDKYLSQITKDNFRVVCDINNPECVSSVRMATWTTANQSDLAWRDAHFNGYGSFFLDINRNEYREKPDVYITHIYIYDAQGGLATEEIAFWPDYIPPTIENYGVNIVSQDCFRVLAKISDNNGISTVKIATWTTGDQRDLVWREAHHNGYGTYFVDIPYSEYRANPEVYISHIYAYDSQENLACVEVSYRPSCSHNYGEWTVSVEPSCTSNGTEKRTCSKCGNTEMRIVESHGHNYNESILSSTCTSQGYTTHTCSVCGDSYTDSYTEPTGHSYNSKITKTASCTEDGVKTFTCKNCDDSYTEPIPATGHKFKDTVVAPTDSAQGYTLHECENCDYSYKDSYTDVKPHSYTSKVTKTASCTEDGLRTYTCSDCGNTYTEVIPKTGHSYTDKVVAPTCTEKGYTLHTCSKCNDSYKTDYTNEKGHSYKSSVTKEPSCEESGVTTYRCSDCDDSYTTAIPAKGHSYTSKSVAATCESSGYVEHTCTVCGNTYKDNYTAATGHAFGEWNITKEPACETSGEQIRTCGNCDKTETKAISPTGHSYTATTVPPTCTDDGYTLHKCSTCGDEYTDNIKPAKGHSYVSERKEATCTSDGYITKKCLVCDDTEITVINATGHKWDSGKVTKPATCTANGVKTYTCSECGKTKTESIKSTGHKYVTKTVAPTYTSQGYTEHTCSVCGYSYKDNYTDKLTRPNISTCIITLSASSYTYDGTAKKPSITVKNGSTILKNGTDYVVTYKNNTNAGTAIVTVTGKGKYSGTASKTFTISKASIAKFNATLSATTYTYNGSAKKPRVTVKNGSKILATSDYTVTYKNNIAIGTATVTIAAKGNYSGTINKTFTITPATVTGFKVASTTANAVKMTWTKTSGAAGYYVYQYNTSTKKWERVKTVTTNNCTVASLNAGTTYKYSVRAYKTVSGKTYLSPSYPTVITSTIPATVNFILTGGSKKATVKWNKVTGATGYIVYYKTSKNGSWQRLTTTKNTVTSFTKTGLKSSSTYYFTVKAFRTVDGKTYNGQFTTKSVKVK